MTLSFKKSLETYATDGHLAIAANLLFDAVFVGWIAFAGLYAIEVVLPTFVTARLSLVKCALLLLLGTSLLVWLSRFLEPSHEQTEQPYPRILLVGAGLVGLSVITLAHYRFPWWSIPIIVAGYGLAVWLFFKSSPA
ncbi:MAG: hypothetical protein WBO92_02695, partial [Candidatus Moraniibacteriota bacterium]